jgi:Tol biopolymer transport system component/DNA-binding winged helix-turn-helix (wHTH) protein
VSARGSIGRTFYIIDYHAEYTSVTRVARRNISHASFVNYVISRGVLEMNENNSGKFQFGPFDVDLRTHELRKGPIKVKLVGQPFQVLVMLLSRPGELVTREELRARLWASDTFVDFDHGLNAAVNKLREALCDSADNPRYVETVPRRGYRFTAAVESTRAATADPLHAPAVESAAVAAAPQSKLKKTIVLGALAEPDKVQRLYPYLAGGGALLLLVLAGTFLLRMVSSRGTDMVVEALPKRVSPLTSLTDPTGQPAFSPNGDYVAFVRGSFQAGKSGIFVKQVGADYLKQLTTHQEDCCPAWSPDGKWVAFSRWTDREVEMYTVPSTGGAERKLLTKGVAPKSGGLDWSPDGNAVAFAAGDGIDLLNLRNSEVRRVTEPPPQSEDWGPKFSPDGQRILFVRRRDMGFSEEVIVLPASGGAAVSVASEHARIVGPPQWSADGRSIIFSSEHNGEPTLWKVAVDTREAPVELDEGGWRPTVSKRGYRLAYERATHNLSVWQVDLSQPGTKEIVVGSTSQTDQGPGPQFSPDGKRLAYMCDRSGTMEIWVSDSDGANPYQLTAVDGAGTPRWSPDGTSIAFDSRSAIFTVDVKSGAVRPMVKDQFENLCPSWSRNGKWIYFASSRTGQFQVWKVPVEGGTPVQVTKRGGHAALESLDGKYVYYAKTPYANPEIWQAPVSGGLERPLSLLIRPASWAAWAVVEHGIVFAGSPGLGKPALSLFDFAKRGVTTLSVVDTVPFWLGATTNGQRIVFDQPGWEQTQVMVVENFR